MSSIDRFQYRGKRLLDNTWMEGTILLIGAGRFGLTDEWLRIDIKHSVPLKQHYGHGYMHWHEIDSNTLCQSSNMRDCNDRLIYEKDIIEWLGHEVKNGKQIRPKRYFVVNNIIEDFYKIFCLSNDGSNIKNVKVVGNVIDNPELMINIDEEKDYGKFM